MARLVLLFILLIGCASQEKSNDAIMSIDIRDEVFSYQNYIEHITSSNDELFVSLKSSICLNNWLDTVASINTKLKKVKKDIQRAPLWNQLATCYYMGHVYKKSLLYYDLSLPHIKSLVELAKIHGNIGQIYSELNHNAIALASFQTSLKSDRYNVPSNFYMIINSLNEGNFNRSLAHIRVLKQKYKKSRTLNFLEGVNYFLMADNDARVNKVLSGFDDQSIEKSLFTLGLRLKNKKRSALDELERLEIKYKLHQNFADFLMSKYGK